MIRPKLYLRDLLWLIVVISLALGWWNYARRTQAEQRDLEHDLLMHADTVNSFVYVVEKLGCELSASSAGHTKIIVPTQLQPAALSFTLTIPREELQQTIEQKYGKRYRGKFEDLK
jgi:hypothetical protein